MQNKPEVPMTDLQALRMETMARIDELDRQDTTDWTAKQIKALVQRKKALRDQLNTLTK